MPGTGIYCCGSTFRKCGGGRPIRRRGRALRRPRGGSRVNAPEPSPSAGPALDWPRRRGRSWAHSFRRNVGNCPSRFTRAKRPLGAAGWRIMNLSTPRLRLVRGAACTGKTPPRAYTAHSYAPGPQRHMRPTRGAVSFMLTNQANHKRPHETRRKIQAAAKAAAPQ